MTKTIGAILVIFGLLLSADFVGKTKLLEWEKHLQRLMQWMKEMSPKIIPSTLSVVPRHKAAWFFDSIEWLDTFGIYVSITSILFFAIFGYFRPSKENYIYAVLGLFALVFLLVSAFLLFDIILQVGSYLFEAGVTFMGGLFRGAILFIAAFISLSVWLTTKFHDLLSSYVQKDKTRSLIGSIGVFLGIIGAILGLL